MINHIPLINRPCITGKITSERSPREDVGYASENRDGENHKRSWNCGAEGPADDPDVCRFRDRQKRNLLATLLLSQGVLMLLEGDEIGRSRQCNNNAYCRDNGISWFDW